MSVLSLLFASQFAHAIPQNFTHQGRLLDTDGVGLEGEHDLNFILLDDEYAGATHWSESLSAEFSNGYYSVVLGNDEDNPLDDQTLSLGGLWLELRLDGQALQPRHPLSSTPYAVMSQVSEDLEGGTVNAAEISVNDIPVIDAAGNWVGPSQSTEWADILNIPSDIADGDDDNDTLAGLGCVAGELAGWDGNQWTCVSDSNLTEADVEAFITNGAIDLHADTTIGGQPIMTTGDGDTLSGLSCVDGELAKWDSLLAEWVCGVDIDTDTVLSEADVENYISNGPLDLATGTTLGGNGILTDASVLSPDWGNIQNRPAGLDDGDDDTQLSESQVENYVSNGAINLSGGSTLSGRNLMGQPSVCADAQVLVYDAAANDWVCGDDNDTTLTPQEMQTMIEAMTLNLQNLPSVNGDPVLTTGSNIDPNQLDSTGAADAQVLTYDSGNIGWADASSGSGCEVVESIVGSPVRMRLQCGANTFIVEGSTLVAVTMADQGIWTSHYHCAIDQSTEIKCWGKSNFELQSGVPAGTGYIQVASAAETSCALNSAGEISCWGYDAYNVPQNTPAGSGYTKLAAGHQHFCALSGSGNISCWGKNNDGQVSNRPSGGGFTDIAAGYAHSCAINSSGGIQCWGWNSHGQVSGVPSGSFTQLEISYYHGCGINSGGGVQCWGYDNDGLSSNTPSGTFSEVLVSESFNIALSNSGDIECWGNGNYCNQVPSGAFSKISIGYSGFCAVSTSGSVGCFGSSTFTQGTPSTGTWVDIESNNESTCGILDSGNVVCWGETAYGQTNPP